MCGIVGLWNRDRAAVDAAALEAARDRMALRGPDDAGLWVEGEVGLAHRRLSIIDLSPRGHQPMASPDGRWQLIFNGEIYNHLDLRKILIDQGYRFQSDCDTEVLVHGFDAWGMALFPKLIGMFAIAVWDRQQRRLSLARGPLGKKPLYLYRDSRKVAFASTLAPLMMLPGVRREIDPDALADYARFGYVPAPRALLAGTEKLLPGESLQIDADGNVTRERYFDLEAIAASPRIEGSDAELLDQLHERLLDATQRRMVADVPVGAFLSGGIDSTLVTALMADRGANVRTFTIAFDDGKLDESRHAAAVAQALGVENTQLKMASDEMLDFVDTIVDHYDEPIADESAFPTLAVSKLARQHVTVALTGDGGDEPYAGYGGYRTMQLATSLFRTTPTFLRRAAAALSSPLPPRLRGLLETLREPTIERLAARYTRWDKTVDAEDLTAGRVRSPETEIAAWMAQRGDREPFERLQLHHALHRMVDAIETKVDRATMAFSLEARSPLLDYRVVEYGFRLPARMKLRDGQTKWALRQILERYLPRTLFERPKQGFEPPMASWLRGPLRERMQEALSGPSLEAFGLFDATAVQRLMQRHLDGSANHTRLLWGLVVLDQWRRRYLS